MPCRNEDLEGDAEWDSQRYCGGAALFRLYCRVHSRPCLEQFYQESYQFTLRYDNASGELEGKVQGSRTSFAASSNSAFCTSKEIYNDARALNLRHAGHTYVTLPVMLQ